MPVAQCITLNDPCGVIRMLVNYSNDVEQTY